MYKKMSDTRGKMTGDAFLGRDRQKQESYLGLDWASDFEKSEIICLAFFLVGKLFS